MISGFGKCPEPKICISMAACWVAGCVWTGWVGWKMLSHKLFNRIREVYFETDVFTITVDVRHKRTAQNGQRNILELFGETVLH